MRLRSLKTLLLVGGLAMPASLHAQASPTRVPDVPPPCPTAVKGRVVAVDPGGASITLARNGKNESHPVSGGATAAVRALKVGAEVTLKLNCEVRPSAVTAVTLSGSPTGPGGPRATPTPDAKLTTILISSPEACTLSVDFKPWGPLKPDVPAELKLGPGERKLQATAPDGRIWTKVIKVGSDQMIVEVDLGPRTATLQEYDAQAAKVYGALQELKTAGPALAEILKSNKFKFEKADSVAIVSAAGTWTRELTVLQAMAAPPARAQVTTDLAALDKHVLEYASQLQKALETAQKNFSVLGEAATYRDRAAAILPLLKPPAR